MIKKIKYKEIENCLSVIRNSFKNIAYEFGLTKENCPKHTSFITIKALKYHWDIGALMFGYYSDNEIVGYVSLEDKGNATFELRNLSVLPEHRHNGYGKALLADIPFRIYTRTAMCLTLVPLKFDSSAA